MEDREERIARACAAAGCAVEAANLTLAGMDHALQKIGTRRHLTAEEVLCGLACVCAEMFGMLAYAVLLELGIGDGNDVGRLAKSMVAEGLLQELDPKDPAEDFGPVAGQLYVFLTRATPAISQTWGGPWLT